MIFSFGYRPRQRGEPKDSSCVSSFQSTGSGTRTRTVVTHQRILSPLRLPFRHAGKAGQELLSLFLRKRQPQVPWFSRFPSSEAKHAINRRATAAGRTK